MKRVLLVMLFFSASASVYAEKVTVKIYGTDVKHQFLGTIVAKDTKNGLLLMPHLKNLPTGEHGFHVHEHGLCDHVGMDAGGHLDPKNTGKHLGPYSQEGHLGDLPALVVDENGFATKAETAPQLTVKDIKGHSLMIHAGGDNYSDNPKMLGGGGARIACGIVP
jgi:Cu-Zn family superoxide dismutase